jgi:hypothetical protein
MKRFGFAVLCAGFLLTFSAPAFSQSCALCYTQAASAATKFIEALRSGILVLMVPPLFITGWLTYIAYKKRNQFNGPPNANEANGGW